MVCKYQYTENVLKYVKFVIKSVLLISQQVELRNILPVCFGTDIPPVEKSNEKNTTNQKSSAIVSYY